jgi:tetratricopeptide (TPR) repeat protein
MIEGPLPAERQPLARYAIAYATWRLAYTSEPWDDLAPALDEALGHLEKAVELNGRFADAHALAGAIQGALIGRNPALGMTLGPPSQASIAHARELEPGNPRVALIEGQSLFHTPEEYGGGIDRAEAALRRALDLFAREPADRPWPNWGRPEAHAWLGQALLRRGDRAGARAQYQRALEIAPDFGWVKHVLLPALDRRP